MSENTAKKASDGDVQAAEIAMESGIILAVADAGIPEGLTTLARYMECSVVEVAEVCAAHRGDVAVVQ